MEIGERAEMEEDRVAAGSGSEEEAAEKEGKKALVTPRRGRPGRTRPVLGLDAMSIGPLELELLDVMWELGRPADMTHIYMPMLERRREMGELISSATVMTVLNRMAAKGLINRERAYGTSIYTPIMSREETAVLLIKDVVAKVLAGDTSGIRHELRKLAGEA